MNKFGAIIILALVAVASANRVPELLDMQDPETQLSLTPSNEDETASLVGDATVFSSFCIKSRDDVANDIKSQTNKLASTIFGMFFKNAEEIGENALAVQKLATDTLGNQIRNPDAPIEAAAAGESDPLAQGRAIITDAQNKIHEAQTQPQTFFQAVVSTVGATGTTVASGVVSRLQGLKGFFGLDKVFNALSSVCDQVAHYEEQNRNSYNEFVKSIAAKDPALAATPFENVACLTTRRISRLDGICKFSAVAQGPVHKILKSVA